MSKITGERARRIEYGRALANGRIPFAREENHKVSVLLVPELRKRRSERDPELLRQQIKAAKPKAHEIKQQRIECLLDRQMRWEEAYKGYSHGRLVRRPL
jgi:hypothetical protein